MNELMPFHHHHRPLNLKPRTHSLASAVSLSQVSTTLETGPPPTSRPPLLQSPSFQHSASSSDIRSAVPVKARHAQMIKSSRDWDYEPKARALVTSYLELGDRGSAVVGFLLGLEGDYDLWASFLEEFESSGGDLRDVLEVFKDLKRRRVVGFGSRVVALILQICASVLDSWTGLGIHAGLIKSGLDLDVYISCALLGFYSRCLGAGIANKVLDEMSEPDDRLWNQAVLMNLENGELGRALELFRTMQLTPWKARALDQTIVKLLQACGKGRALDQGKQIHGYVLKQGLESNSFICNSLVTMYSRNHKLNLATRAFDLLKDPSSSSSWNSIISGHASHGHLNDAWSLFREMECSGAKPDTITWNCMLSGHAVHGSCGEVLSILRRMQMAGFRPDSSSITVVLQAVIQQGLLNSGKEIHGYAMRNEHEFDVYVGTSLVDMYVKNDCMISAQAVFDSMKNKNIFAWNALISGYSFQGQFHDAERALARMEGEGIEPDLFTWNALIAGYSMHGKSDEALAVIDHIKSSGSKPSVVTWTALISGASQQGNYRESLKHFIRMQREGIRPNSATISSLVRSLASLSLLQNGKEAHCFSIRNGFVEDAFVTTAVIDMYCKSGEIKSANAVFKNTKNKTVPCWNCMMMGFANFGLGTEVIRLFDEMQSSGLIPDAISFTAVLSGCKNSGLVSEGWEYFDSMSKAFGIEPTAEHYSCMVDLLGRAGYLDEAWDFIETMPSKPDATMWGAFLGSCRIHRNLEYAEIAARQLYELEPRNSANYAVMMNLYAMSNRWGDVDRIKDVMRDKGVKPGPIWSWILIDNRAHVFHCGGKPHEDEGKIYFELYRLVSEIKKLGYVADMECCINQKFDDDAEREKLLLSHTEKLAITYGLIKKRRSSSSGTMIIRVIKNTRTCSDCHTAAKLISIARRCEIILGDGTRFHHFKEGECSCKDYW